MAKIEQIITNIDAISKKLRALDGKQVRSTELLRSMRELSELYFASVKPSGDGGAVDLEAVSTRFRSLLALSRSQPSRSKCIELFKQLRKDAVALEGASIANNSNDHQDDTNQADALIISSLDEICPSASAAYQQALIDLRQTDRLSWRGPATDLREALRETLDVLAPDADVESVPGFKHEPDARRPTMKQKTRYVMRNRGLASGQIATPVDAVVGIEEFVGGLTRSVYTRSSVSTHTPSTKIEVVRIHSWVRLVLCELLEIPL